MQRWKIDEVILKYLKKEMTIEDQHSLSKWLAEDDLNQNVLDRMERLWNEEDHRTQKAKGEIWNKLMDRVEINSRAEKRIPIYPARNMVKIAALLVVTFFLSFLILEYTTLGVKEVAEQVRYIEKVSLYGQKINIQLPDGTRVKLNAGSKLITPKEFIGQTREIELVGEAFFEVKRDEARPFIVRSGELDVRVLGTSFNIRAYPEEGSIQVAVNTGKVVVKSEKKAQELLLVPEEMAVYNKSSATSFKTGFNQKAVFGWKDKILYFDRASFDEILYTLKKWYGVEFILNNAVDDNKEDFSGAYHNKSLESVLEGLSYVFGFEYQLKDEVVTIN